MDKFSQNSHSTDTTLRDYARVLFKHEIIIFVIFAVVICTVYIGLQFKTPVYEAKVKMLVSGEQQGAEVYSKDLRSRGYEELSVTRSQIVKSMPVTTMAVEALRLYERPIDYEKKFASPIKKKWLEWQSEQLAKKTNSRSPEEQLDMVYRSALETLRRKIEVEPIRDTSMFIIKVSDYDPKMAAVMANVVSRSYVVFDLQQQKTELQLKYGERHPLIRQLTDSIEEILKDLNGEHLEGMDAIGPATVKIIEQASPPLKSSSSSKTLTMAMALVMSLFLGGMMAFIFEYMDQTVKSAQELESLLRLPLIGTIPRRKFFQRKLIKNSRKVLKRSRYYESYRNLADQVRLLAKNKKMKSILITSPDESEGVSTTVVNLGFYLANYEGINTLVIDGNCRKASLHKMFKLPQFAGLSDVLEGSAGLGEVVQKVAPQFGLITAGKVLRNPMNAIASGKMGDILDKLKEKFDVILVDGVDLKHYKDSVAMAAYVDSVILLVSEHKTRRQVIQSVITPLKEQGSRLTGAILNNRTFAIPGFVYNRI